MVANIIIIAVVALIFGLCLKKVISGMKGGSCDGCSGCGAGCGGNCGSNCSACGGACGTAGGNKK